MKILVIGSKGFIGSHCMRYFTDRGHRVTGCDVHEKNTNLLFTGNQFDCCINAAGSALVNYSFQFPEKDFEMNVSLVTQLLGAIKNHCPECKLINFSSAAVYGNPSMLPVKEEAETRPLSPYGYHKLLSEKVLIEYSRFFNLKTCTLRVFSAYGSGLKKQLFWDLYERSLHEETIRLFGRGMESRDFIYIDDLLEIVNLVVQNGRFDGDVYNVANGEEICIKDAAESFFDELGRKVNIVFTGQEKTGDPSNWKADISKIKALGYKRKFTFRQGLGNYCKWLRELK